MISKGKIILSDRKIRTYATAMVAVDDMFNNKGEEWMALAKVVLPNDRASRVKIIAWTIKVDR